MPCPREILEAFESVTDIYFSHVHHRERAAFILCDTLIETACRIKAHEMGRLNNPTIQFPNLLSALHDVVEDDLRSELNRYHSNRNPMQHGNAGLTVGIQFCAAAILDAIKTVEQLWPGAATTIKGRGSIAIRMIQLYASNDYTKHEEFEAAMLEYEWRQSKETPPKTVEVNLRPGIRNNWGWAIRNRRPEVEEVLNKLGIA